MSSITKKIFGACQRTEKLWDMRMTVMPVVVGAFGTVPRRWNGSGRIRDQGEGRNYIDYSSVKIG